MKIPKDIPYIIFASCMFVEGAKKSLICDIQRKQYFSISKEVHDILVKNEGRTVNDILQEKYIDTASIIDIFEKLNNEEIIYFSSSPGKFPKISRNYETPFDISNAIIDIDAKSDFNLLNVLQQLEDNFCKSVQLRFFEFLDFNLLESALVFLQKNQSFIQSIEVIGIDNGTITEEVLQRTMDQNPRISSISIYNSKRESFHPLDGQLRYYRYLKDKVYNAKSCGKISSSFFIINEEQIAESMNHNSCLNGKISIDSQGNIKNCPSMLASYGSINNTTITEVIKRKKFKKYWNITKDKIAGCKDCEFRYICTDCRAYVENPSDIYSKPLKCGYNPYKGEWEDWSKNPLKQKAIAFYDLDTRLTVTS